jgi:nucleotide-binding universal stress UspA family protein
MDAIKRILVPTDFSAHADEAFRAACALARATGAEVIVFHVARPPAVISEGGALLTQPGEAPTNLWDRFGELQSGDPRVRVQHEVIMADRPSAAHILEILDKLGCDLIVMGTHGRRGWRHVLFGSLTEDVVRRARCPVMVVKAPAPAQEPEAPEKTPAATGNESN